MGKSVANQNAILAAVGFKMKNLKDFPFSHLSNNLQMAVIKELDITERIQLMKVNKDLRRAVIKDGRLGKQVDRIDITFDTDGDFVSEVHRIKAACISITKGSFNRQLDFTKFKALFGNIETCAIMKIDVTKPPDFVGLFIPVNAMKTAIECFPNLRLVETLQITTFLSGNFRQMASILPFKTTKSATIIFIEGSSLEQMKTFMKEFLKNQLKATTSVTISNMGIRNYFVPDLDGIPGLEIVRNPPQGMTIEMHGNVKAYRRRLQGGQFGFVGVHRLPNGAQCTIM